MYWLLFSAPTISVLWVAFGGYFFSFYTRYLFSLIGFVFLSWSPNFSSSNFSSAAVLLAKPKTCKYETPRLWSWLSVSHPLHQEWCEAGIFALAFPCRVMPLDAHIPLLGSVTVTVVQQPWRQSQPESALTQAGRAWKCHPGCSQLSHLYSQHQLLCRAAAGTSSQLLRKFYFCACIDTDLLK